MLVLPVQWLGTELCLVSQGRTGFPVTSFGFQLCEQTVRERELRRFESKRGPSNPMDLFMCFSPSAHAISHKIVPLTFLTMQMTPL